MLYRHNLKNRFLTASTFSQYCLLLASWQWSLAPAKNSERASSHTFSFSSRFSKAYRLTDLLPYDTSTKTTSGVKSGLQEYYVLLEILKLTLEAFENGEFSKFDALVGENACQIRAIGVALFASQYVVNQSLKDRIEQIQLMIHCLLDQIDILMQKKIPLSSLLNNELELHLNEREFVLLQTFLLSFVMERRSEKLCMKAIAEPKNIKKIGDVSKSFGEALLRKFRKNIASYSVEFIRNNALISEYAADVRMVSNEYTSQHLGLPCIPMFWTYRTVLNAAKRHHIPIIIHVKLVENVVEGEDFHILEEDYLLFKPSKDGKEIHFVRSAVSNADLPKAAIIVEGVCSSKGEFSSIQEWRRAIENYCVETIILAGAADHRQYPNPDDDKIIEKLDDKDYLYFRELARKEGFSLENPTKFFIQHVYTSQIGKFGNFIDDSEPSRQTASLCPSILSE